MKKKKETGMQPEYDFSGGTRAKYAKEFAKGSNLVVLAPDVVSEFPYSNSVNETLRAIIKIAQRRRKKVLA
jgi:hypothetical protein